MILIMTADFRREEFTERYFGESILDSTHPLPPPSPTHLSSSSIKPTAPLLNLDSPVFSLSPRHLESQSTRNHSHSLLQPFAINNQSVTFIALLESS